MPSGVPLLIQFFQARTQGADTLGDQAPIGFQLRFAGAAQADTALLPLQVSPASDQPRGEVRELRELHLQLTLEAPGALRKDIQNQAVTVQYSTTSQFLQVAFLAGRQCLIDENQIGAMRLCKGMNLLGLTRPDEILRIRPRAG